MPAATRPQKISFAEMSGAGVRGVLASLSALANAGAGDVQPAPRRFFSPAGDDETRRGGNVLGGANGNKLVRA